MGELVKSIYFFIIWFEVFIDLDSAQKPYLNGLTFRKSPGFVIRITNNNYNQKPGYSDQIENLRYKNLKNIK